jgi:hypothetical protein
MGLLGDDEDTLRWLKIKHGHAVDVLRTRGFLDTFHLSSLWSVEEKCGRTGREKRDADL